MTRGMFMFVWAFAVFAGALASAEGLGSDPIVGKWMWGKRAVEVRADRTATMEPGVAGGWKFLNTDEAERKYRFVWNGGKSAEDVSLSADGNTADVRNNLDEVYEATRIIEAPKRVAPIPGARGASTPEQERTLRYVKDLESLMQTLGQIGNVEFLKSVKAEHDAYARGGTTNGYPDGAAAPGNARILRNAFEADLKLIAKGGAVATPSPALAEPPKRDPSDRVLPKAQPVAAATPDSDRDFIRGLTRGEFSWERVPIPPSSAACKIVFADDGYFHASGRLVAGTSGSGLDGKWRITGPRAVTLALDDNRRAILQFDPQVSRFDALDFDGKTRIRGAFPAPSTQPKEEVERGSAKDELKRVWTEYQGRLAESLKPYKEPYLKEMERIEREAIRSGDVAVAAAIHSELENPDFGDALREIPEKKVSPQLTEVRQLRTDFERKRDDAARTANAWCRDQLEILERYFLQRNDPASAAAIHVERDAVSQPPLRIIRASYGDDRTVDITMKLRKAVRFNRLEIEIGNNLAGDPAPEHSKHSSIVYKIGSGPEKRAGGSEAEIIRLPR